MAALSLCVPARDGEITPLRAEIGERGSDCGNFIAADPPVHKLLCTGFGIEMPASIPLHQGDWKRPIVGSDLEHHLARVRRDELVLRVISREKLLPLSGIGIFVSGADQLFTSRA